MQPPVPASRNLPRFSPDARREILLESARSAFVEHGFSQARTKDIADSAGVAEGLVFKYFGTKEGLFEHAVLEPLQAAVGRVVAAADEFAIHDASQRGEDSVEFHRQMVDAMVECAPLLGLALFSQRDRGRTFYREHVHPLVEAITHAVERALKPLPGPRIDPRVVALAMSGAYFGYGIDAQLGASGPTDPAWFAQQLTALFDHGAGRTRPLGPTHPLRGDVHDGQVTEPPGA